MPKDGLLVTGIMVRCFAENPIAGEGAFGSPLGKYVKLGKESERTTVQSRTGGYENFWWLYWAAHNAHSEPMRRSDPLLVLGRANARGDVDQPDEVHRARGADIAMEWLRGACCKRVR